MMFFSNLFYNSFITTICSDISSFYPYNQNSFNNFKYKNKAKNSKYCKIFIWRKLILITCRKGKELCNLKLIVRQSLWLHLSSRDMFVSPSSN